MKTYWEIRGFGQLAVADTELEAWLNFFELRGAKLDGFSFLYMVENYRRFGIKATEIRTEAHD